MRILLILAFLALSGCRGNVLAPSAVARPAAARAVATDGWYPTGAIETKRLHVSVSGDSITFQAEIDLHGWLVEQFAYQVHLEEWQAGVEIDADMDGYREFGTGYGRFYEDLRLYWVTADMRNSKIMSYGPASLYLDEHTLRLSLPLAQYGLAPGQPFGWTWIIADSYNLQRQFHRGDFHRGPATLGEGVQGTALPDPVDPPLVQRGR